MGWGTVDRKVIDPIDAYVGEKLRMARLMRGLTQEKLGAMERVTFQQIQKYESGANRISASRLVHFSVLLDVPMSWFFDGLPEMQDRNDVAPDKDMKGINCRDTQDLLRAYYGIADKDERKFLRHIMMRLSAPKH